MIPHCRSRNTIRNNFHVALTNEQTAAIQALRPAARGELARALQQHVTDWLLRNAPVAAKALDANG